MDSNANCKGCGTPLADGVVDWYCPNRACDYEQQRTNRWFAAEKERKERAEYERLKAKFDPPANQPENT